MTTADSNYTARAVFVGIDPSITNTGVVAVNSAGALVLAFNGRDAGTTKGRSTPYSDIARYRTQAAYIADRLGTYNVAGMAYEDYSFESTHKAYSLAEYGGILKQALLTACEPDNFFLVAPMQAKKFATGHGYADKNTVKDRALAECPELNTVCDRLTSDICDAYFLAKIAWYRALPREAQLTDLGTPCLRRRFETLTKIERNPRNGQHI